MNDIRVIHTTRPGAQVKFIGDGRAIVVHPDEQPYMVNPDGTTLTVASTDERRIYLDKEMAERRGFYIRDSL